MPYITREDGEHFVIPSYRDVLSAKQKSALKRDILLLSQSYGEYITLQRKSPTQYEVAFSPDTGYLLGESIWQYFKRPVDMIYCEAIPNTTEAILVIVKSGSVYLDGSFPMDSIPEELIIFQTQKNNFEIYISGDVPIAQTPQEGKFCFDASSVKSFKILDKPVFPVLPLLKTYQLQLVDPVLKAHGIGVFPVKQVLTVVVAVGLLWMIWSYLTTERAKVPTVEAVNPYQSYIDILNSPAPDQEISKFLDMLKTLYTMPGWVPVVVKYSQGNLNAIVQSTGSSMQDLYDWVQQNGATANIKPDGVYVSMSAATPARSSTTAIYPIKQVIASFVDKLSAVYPGNHLKLNEFTNKGVFTDVKLNIAVDRVSPLVIALIGKQLKDLPFVLQNIELNVKNGNLTGSIVIEALGN